MAVQHMIMLRMFLLRCLVVTVFTMWLMSAVMTRNTSCISFPSLSLQPDLLIVRMGKPTMIPYDACKFLSTWTIT